MFAEIRNPHGERLDAAFHPASPDSGPDGNGPDDGGPDGGALVVIGHGVTANKDRVFLVALAEGLAAAGFAALRLSWSGNGASEGRFEDSTISKEVADLGAVLDAIGDRRIAYVGHSMGGAVGVLRAARDDRIRALVSLAGMVDTAGFAQRKFGDRVPGRDTMWDKPECPLSQAFLDDMAAIGSVAAQAGEVRVPWLLVHGTDDSVVPFADSETARERAGGPVELVRLEGADHLFTDHCAPMVKAVVDWLRAQSI